MAAEGPSKGFSWMPWKEKRPRTEAPMHVWEWEGQLLRYIATKNKAMLIKMMVGDSHATHLEGSGGGGGRGGRDRRGGFSLRRVGIWIAASGAGEEAIGVLPIGEAVNG